MTILHMVMNILQIVTPCCRREIFFINFLKKLILKKTFIVNWKSSSLNIPPIQENVWLCGVFAFKNKFGQQLRHF